LPFNDAGIIDDTIDVRPDEQIDVGRVADYLHGKLPGAEGRPALRQFGGGSANLTYLLDYGDHEYVLRRPPLGPVAKSAHDMGREYRVLSVLYQVFPEAPRAFLYSEDEDIVGAPFLVMERRRGAVVRRSMPDVYAKDPHAARRMSEALVDTLAEFHAVDYEAIGLKDLGRPAGFVERQIAGWYRRWHAAKTEDVTEMDATYTWLKDNRPQSVQFSLVHNDYKLDNVMLSYDDPGEIVAVFDWDMCTLGDPLADLGALLCYWSEPGDPLYRQAMARMPVADLGFLTREEIVQRYAQNSGRYVGHINFYHALGMFRLTVIIAQIYIRFVRGQTQDQRFAHLGPTIPLLAQAAHEIAFGKA
jgi:aminoglycoside phosphotransferase (APT) family kinase protein